MRMDRPYGPTKVVRVGGTEGLVGGDTRRRIRSYCGSLYLVLDLLFAALA